MPRRTAAALLLAAFIATLSAVPGISPPAAAASCSSWTSESQPPPSIRVFRAASGAVETVDFRAYVKNVLSREWIGSWTAESLRSGALAVKNYAWYQVLHWRGYVADGSGQCFDVFDTTRDQVYDPSRTTWASAASAVDATWSTLALKAGHIFPTYYNAGTAYEACGANANGWKMYQWGTQACGLAGRTAAQIMALYYAGVVVTDAPPAGQPPPAPSPTPAPTAAPTTQPTRAPTPGPTASGTPAATASPSARPTPAATPRPTAAPTPETGEQPGGGQSGVVNIAAPPPPPPPRPKPIVVKPHAHAAAASKPVASPVGEPRTTQRIPRGADLLPAASPVGADLRLATFRVLFPQAMQRLAGELSDNLFRGGRPLLLALLPAS